MRQQRRDKVKRDMALSSTDTQRLAEHPSEQRAYPIFEIVPATPWTGLELRELWRYRELVYFFTWRDIKVRYKQTVLGAAWAIIQPVINMVVFTVIFGRVAHLPSQGMPYAVFTFAALLPWTYFAYVLQQGGTSLITNANMLSKIYFPRLLLPMSSALAGLVDFLLAFVVFALLMVWFHIHLGLQVLFLPLFLLLAMTVAVGVGVWMAALSVEYRDVRYVIPFLTQVWLYASPVAYGASLVKGKLATVYALNPMAGVVEGFRWSLLGTSAPPLTSLVLSVVVAVIVLVSGLFYFRRVEQSLADVV